MEVRSCMRRWPVVALAVTAFGCADQADTELDTEFDAVPPAAETAPEPTTTMLSEADVMQVVTSLNQTEIDEGELARSKSDNEQVLEFAEMMVTDHTRLLEEAEQIGVQGTADATTPPAGAAGTDPETPGAAPPTPAAQPPVSAQGSAVIQQLDQESQSARSQLEGLSGAEFDQAYIARQVEAHQRALDLIEMQLLPAAQDPQLLQTLESARPVIQQHLQRAREIQQQLDSGTPATTDTTGTGGPEGGTV